jgi:tetratricopeptide (TPR) repeat protein
MKTQTLLFVMILAVGGGSATAAPFVPGDDAQVLERLPYRAASPAMRELSAWRGALRDNPSDLPLAVRLAWRYVELGRAEADPRYYGYAQAALEPWWDEPQPAPEVLLLRATLRQNRHDFQGALKDLEQLLKMQPRNAQAWLTRAVILGVQGDYPNALRSCMPLSRLTTALLASACTGSVLSVAGQAEAGYRALQQALANNPQADPRERLWALTILAETAARLGRTLAAEQHFQQALALGVRDVYLLSAYADFLFDQDRPAEVRALLGDDTRPDPFLLRLTLAEQRLNSPQANAYRDNLQARIQANRLRGDTTHLGGEACFALHLSRQPAEALQLALRNWTVQREPADARLVLEAALAANDARAARPVLDWLRKTRLEDVRLAALAKSLEERQP